jgi:hypothetical protein
MAIDILNIEKSKIKPGLEGKIITLAGLPKCGKSTFASKAPSPLFISTEPGLGLLSGIKAAPCNSWTDYKQIVKQLKTDEAKAMYKTIVIDTVPNLWEQCAKFVWIQKNDGSDLSDYTMGMQQNKSMPEFSTGIMDIAKAGYTIILICHNVAKDVPNELGFKYGTEIIIDLPKRPRNFIFGLCDLLINVITEPTENGPDKATMYLRQSTHNGIKVEAGGRYPDIIESAPFNYETLVKLIEEEDKKMAADGADLTGKKTAIQETITDPSIRDWKETVKDVNATLKVVTEISNGGDLEISNKVKDIIASYLGDKNKITEANPSQQELVEAALVEIKSLVAKK